MYNCAYALDFFGNKQAIYIYNTSKQEVNHCIKGRKLLPHCTHPLTAGMETCQVPSAAVTPVTPAVPSAAVATEAVDVTVIVLPKKERSKSMQM